VGRGVYAGSRVAKRGGRCITLSAGVGWHGFRRRCSFAKPVSSRRKHGFRHRQACGGNPCHSGRKCPPHLSCTPRGGVRRLRRAGEMEGQRKRCSMGWTALAPWSEEKMGSVVGLGPRRETHNLCSRNGLRRESRRPRWLRLVEGFLGEPPGLPLGGYWDVKDPGREALGRWLSALSSQLLALSS